MAGGLKPLSIFERDTSVSNFFFMQVFRDDFGPSPVKRQDKLKCLSAKKHVRDNSQIFSEPLWQHK